MHLSIKIFFSFSIGYIESNIIIMKHDPFATLKKI